jgi:poly(3-hydroxybutyrate) depolymerase
MAGGACLDAAGSPPDDAGRAGEAARAERLTRDEAAQARAEAWAAFVARVRPACEAEIAAGAVERGGVRMPFAWSERGAAPPDGRSLWISLHGGGGAPPRVNDQQWENQKRLYAPAEGIYVAPRAPGNEWNLWHQAPVDALLDGLITDMVVARGVNPDRVHILGYSAGGDGVYQLAPRMADRWAAAAMMAGHPNDARPDGLRNIGFTLHVGADDSAFNRNGVAREWERALAALAAADPGGYAHWVHVHPGKGHWMDREDAEALPWMARFTRDLRPARVVWVQDDVTHPRSYWLAVDDPRAGARIVAEREGQVVRLVEAPAGTTVRIRLDDSMLDLDRPVRVVHGERVLFEGVVPRERRVIERTLAERGDPRGVFVAEVEVRVPRAAPLPDAWLGRWSGAVEVLGADGAREGFAMELRIEPLGREDECTWTIVYDGAAGRQERPYRLVDRDGDAGRLAIDERNGIVLPARLLAHTLYSEFAVEGSRVAVRYELVDGGTERATIRVEMATTREEGAERTGGGDVPEVRGWTPQVVQRATLRRGAAP